jgi:ribosomal 50S subunit-recycling heat shock protein
VLHNALYRFFNREGLVEFKHDLCEMETRINKFLSEVGFCSRRAADRLLEQGKITINGKVPELGTKVKSVMR